jgi:hypothetical protein
MTKTITNISGQSVTFKNDDGTTGSMSVDLHATITLDGKTANLADLRSGDKVEFSGNPATSVTVARAAATPTATATPKKP